MRERHFAADDSFLLGSGDPIYSDLQDRERRELLAEFVHRVCPEQDANQFFVRVTVRQLSGWAIKVNKSNQQIPTLELLVIHPLL